MSNRKERPRLCFDTVFKNLFIYNSDILEKMINDITSSNDYQIDNIVPGYEVEPYRYKGKTNKSDMLIKVNDNNYINIEVNYHHEKSVLYRNNLQLYRIFAQLIDAGMEDVDIAKYKICQLNFNTFRNENKKEIEKGIYVDEITGSKLNDMATIWNLDIARCYNMLYNKNIKNLPKWVRWGALLYTELGNIEEIEIIIGGDLLTMEQKDKFMTRVKDINDDNRIVQEWMVEENNRLRELGIKQTAYEEGEEKGIKKGIKQGIEQGIEKSQKNVILNMLKEKADYSFISKVTGKSTSYIKSIARML